MKKQTQTHPPDDMSQYDTDDTVELQSNHTWFVATPPKYVFFSAQHMSTTLFPPGSEKDSAAIDDTSISTLQVLVGRCWIAFWGPFSM